MTNDQRMTLINRTIICTIHHSLQTILMPNSGDWGVTKEQQEELLNLIKPLIASCTVQIDEPLPILDETFKTP